MLKISQVRHSGLAFGCLKETEVRDWRARFQMMGYGRHGRASILALFLLLAADHAFANEEIP